MSTGNESPNSHAGWICPGCGEWTNETGHACRAGESYRTMTPVEHDANFEIEELHNPYLARIATALERIADVLEDDEN